MKFKRVYAIFEIIMSMSILMKIPKGIRNSKKRISTIICIMNLFCSSSKASLTQML